MATILIVDDVAANRARLAQVLGGQGHRLIEAANGREALATVAGDRPDLVITDLLMPVMDGYELVKQLRLNPVTLAIPVLFYTAPYAERDARAQVSAGRGQSVLAKAAPPEEVLAIVARVLAGGSALADAQALETVRQRQQLRLVTEQLSDTAEDLTAANARLRALVNIGLDLASARDPDRLLRGVCADAVDLFGASYSSLGIFDPDHQTVRRFVTFGTDVEDWVKPGDTMTGALAALVAEGQPLRGENPDGNAERLQLPRGHPEVIAFLAVPIATPSRVYGWFKLVGNEGQTFTEEDEDLLLALAGQVGRLYELEHEVNERRQAEQALLDERDRSRQYLDVAEVLILALDTTGRITLINRHACTLLGWTADELVGRDWYQTCLPAHCREWVRHQVDAAREGDPATIENLVLTRSGEERLIEWRPTVMRDAHGVATGTLSSGTDITAREQAVADLRQAEERMRFALQSADVGVWDMDYATGTLEWSETLEAQYGLAPGEFEGTLDAFLAAIHPDDRDEVRSTVVNASTTGDDFTVEHRVRWPDGTERWLSGAGRVHLGSDGRPVRGVGISMDVSARHAMEAQYRQAQKMEAIGRLAGGVAHDFNNLLTVILGYCDVMLADTGPSDPRNAPAVEIQKAGLSATALTRQLLAFSRKEIIEPTVLDLNEIIAAMGTLLERLIGEDVQVVQVLRPGLAPVCAARSQMEQVVMNLALNARDAMPDGGRLTIETDNITFDEHYTATHLDTTPGQHVMLTVSDTGSGMSREVQARIFEPFFTTKSQGRGTGLGLATVHGIVTQAGGTVKVYSEPGNGSSFKVYLPCADRVAPAEEDLGVEGPAAAGAQTILVVEDLEQLRKLFGQLLERQGFTVLLAANADEALQLFDQPGAIDVLLTDVVMPGRSGPELAVLLLAQQPTLKVIYMSGYTEDTIVHRGVLQPGIAFLHKPFTADLLSRKIREVLDQPMER
ncbi:MAG: response regulator [Gemmatimonadales bacterium]